MPLTRKQVYIPCPAAPDTLNLVVGHVLASCSDPNNFEFYIYIYATYPVSYTGVKFKLSQYMPQPYWAGDWATLEYYKLALVFENNNFTGTRLMLSVRDHDYNCVHCYNLQ